MLGCNLSCMKTEKRFCFWLSLTCRLISKSCDSHDSRILSAKIVIIAILYSYSFVYYFGAYYSLLVTRYSLLVTRYSLLVTRYLALDKLRA